MKIHEVFENPLSGLLAAERYVNDGSPSGFSSASELSLQHRPLEGSETIQIPVFYVPWERVVSFGRIEAIRDRVGTCPQDCIPVPVHPGALESVLQDRALGGISPAATFDAAPTASGRTVLAVGDKPFFVKLHFPGRIGRFNRAMPLYKWIGAKESAHYLREFLRGGLRSFSHLDEVGGVFAESERGPGFGTVYRDLPERTVSAGAALLPAFSLFSRDHRNAADPSLLAQILERWRMDADSFIEVFVAPLVHSYVQLAVEAGLIPECNAQNVLFRVLMHSEKVEIYFRDMEDLWKDLTVRESLGLESSCVPYHTIRQSEGSDYFERRSFLFDFKFGEYLVVPLIEEAARFLRIRSSDLVSATRRIVRDAWSVSPGYFPYGTDWFRYPRERDVSRSHYERTSHARFR
ncbi:MAG: hypothetical protein HY854_05920 [Burkholderiales bacterium]|nr:hypothetical protein [Burkholderiales bacterium]